MGQSDIIIQVMINKAKYRYSGILLKELVTTDFKLRYQSSALGYLWSLLRPLLLFVILYFVFVKFLKVGSGVPHYPVYLLLGIVFWNYFGEVTNNGVGSIVGKGDLLRKMNFPKYVIPLAGSASALINLALNFVVITVFMIISGVTLSWSILLVPLIVLELFILALSLAFLLGSLYVKLRDVNYIWEVFMQGAFYATPIIYPISIIPHWAQALLILNPVAQIIQDARYALITTDTTTIGTIYGTEWARLIPLAIVLIIGLISIRYFKKQSPYFAEDV